MFDQNDEDFVVSTHSRLKAAGRSKSWSKHFCDSFNTQPPEGGWLVDKVITFANTLFQHTAA